ncbi:MAG: cyclopropane-fatty-acyl-phospholipid synthase family protein [Bdellovibrionales bacterium]|nr:cyclopropane-fatty-acyl-phospholipid synthase family protein [Bdellovibrionales bacterium]
MLSLLIELTERGVIPNSLVRIGIRKLCADRLKELRGQEKLEPRFQEEYIEMLKASPIAVFTEAANEQHYEVPADFFLQVLGSNLKYSSGYWTDDAQSLDQAEREALDITMQRAELRDGMEILELGCGWGSLSLSMAQKFPQSKITAVSNSSSQRQFIEGEAKKRNLKNLRVITQNVVLLENFEDSKTFDRVVSVEMFEHLRNYEVLFRRISNWLKPDGKLFVHIFTHKNYAYLFETEGDDNWMGKYFFTGGQMPSHDLFKSFQSDLTLEKQWLWDGTHYQKTSEAWLSSLEKNRHKVIEILAKTYGEGDAFRWYNRWKVFFLAVAELFGYKNGSEWGVSHYLFSKDKK